MRVLLDQNISYRLIPLLKRLFDQIEHVSQVGLEDTDDFVIRKYAKEKNLAIMTFDKDFVELSNLFGVPPKVIWIRLSNPSNAEVMECIESNLYLMQQFVSNIDYAQVECLEIK